MLSLHEHETTITKYSTDKAITFLGIYWNIKNGRKTKIENEGVWYMWLMAYFPVMVRILFLYASWHTAMARPIYTKAMTFFTHLCIQDPKNTPQSSKKEKYLKFIFVLESQFHFLQFFFVHWFVVLLCGLRIPHRTIFNNTF